MLKTILFFASLGSLSSHASSIVVTADKLPSKLETTSNQVFIIDEQLETSSGEFIWENLEKLPSLNITNSGGPGQTSTLSIRGADSRHSLILFEGIELNDSSTTGNLADLSSLSTSGISRIEVLPGSQSVLYGSDAIGGVVEYRIKDLTHIKRPHFEYSGSFGSHSQNALGITHYSKGYFLNVNQASSKGISQTSVGHNDSSEKDGYFLGSATAKFQYDFNDRHQLSLLTQLQVNNTEFDKGFGSPRDDSNYETDGRKLLYKLESRHILMEGKWEPQFSYSRIENKREDEDRPDTLSSTVTRFNSRFSRTKLSNQNNFFIDRVNTLIAGFETEKETGQTESLSSGSLSGLSPSSEENHSFYLLHKRADKIFWSTGLRVQSIDSNNEVTYKVAPGLKFEDGRAWISFSTGFKNPSLFQKFSSDFGNTNLLPERSKSIEIGSNINYSSDLNLNMVFFLLDIENLIDTTGSFPNITYINQKEAKIFGVNLNLEHKYFGININRQSAYDQDDKELINRPKLDTLVYLKHQISDYKIRLESDYKGPRDSGSSFNRTRLPGRNLLNFEVSYDFRRTLLTYFKLKNILNKDYTEVSDFNSDGINFNIGLNWRY